MREEFQLIIDPEKLRRLLSGALSAIEFLQDTFGKKGDSSYAMLTRSLEAYHNKDGGSPEVRELELIDVKFDADKHKGSFRAKFTLHFHYTCSDVHNHAKDIISWDFQINEQSGTIKFIGEQPWIRDAE